MSLTRKLLLVLLVLWGVWAIGIRVAHAANTAGVAFGWGPMAGATGVRVEISDCSYPTVNVLFDQFVPAPTLKLPQLAFDPALYPTMCVNLWDRYPTGDVWRSVGVVKTAQLPAPKRPNPPTQVSVK
jgi:hypothetical protein